MTGVPRRVRSRTMMGLAALVLTAGALMLGGSPAGASLSTGSFTYSGPVVPIPDGQNSSGTMPGARANANLPVSGMTGTITDLALVIGGTSCNTTAGSTTVGIDHTYVSDLVVTLVSPSGTRVDVLDHIDSSGNNICQTILWDNGPGPSINSVVFSDAPFTGIYQPSHPLAAFKGESPNGTWHLQARDYYSADTGNIRAFSLIIQTDTPPSVTAHSSVAQGGCFTLSGQGLAHNRTYGVSIGRGTFLRDVTTDSNGAFSESVCIPRTTPVGTQVVTVSDGDTTASTTTVQVTRG